jgi:Uma2 family endonuclease
MTSIMAGAERRVPVPAEQRLVLYDVTWKQYLAFADALEGRHIRLTYDRGNLEIMTISPKHERSKHLLGLLVMVLCEELDIDIAGYGSMTCKREDLERAMEPDECYWIANEPLVRGRDDIDLTRDPPFDLGLEVEVSRSVLNRLGIYAALKVAEVWRFTGHTLHVLLLDANGEYVKSAKSRAFPFLPVAELARFCALGATMSDTKVLRLFRAWVREQIEQGWPATQAKRKPGKQGRPSRKKK